MCQRTKAQDTLHRRKATKSENGTLDGELGAERGGGPASFGDLVTADHVVLGSSQESSRRGDTFALIVQDHATTLIECHPAQSKPAKDTMAALIHFAGPNDKVGRLYIDWSGYLSSVARDLLWRHYVSMPQRPQPNSVAEQAVRRVLEGALSLLLQPGLPHPCWRDAANACCALRNAVDKVDGDETPDLLRHGAHVGGQLIPC